VSFETPNTRPPRSLARWNARGDPTHEHARTGCVYTRPRHRLFGKRAGEETPRNGDQAFLSAQPHAGGPSSMPTASHSLSRSLWNAHAVERHSAITNRRFRGETFVNCKITRVAAIARGYPDCLISASSTRSETGAHARDAVLEGQVGIRPQGPARKRRSAATGEAHRAGVVEACFHTSTPIAWPRRRDGEQGCCRRDRRVMVALRRFVSAADRSSTCCSAIPPKA